MPVAFWLICFSDTIKGALRHFTSWSCCQMERLLSRQWQSG